MPRRLAVAVLSAALSTACAARARTVPSDLDLADRVADCSCAYSMFVLTTRETGDVDRIRQAEKLVASIGYFVAAGQALSTKEHVERRRDATLERYAERKSRDSDGYPDDVRRRRLLDALSADLAECTALQKENRQEIDAAVRAQVGQRRESTP